MTIHQQTNLTAQHTHGLPCVIETEIRTLIDQTAFKRVVGNLLIVSMFITYNIQYRIYPHRLQ